MLVLDESKEPGHGTWEGGGEWWCSGSNYGSRGIFCQEIVSVTKVKNILSCCMRQAVDDCVCVVMLEHFCLETCQLSQKHKTLAMT